MSATYWVAVEYRDGSKSLPVTMCNGPEHAQRVAELKAESPHYRADNIAAFLVEEHVGKTRKVLRRVTLRAVNPALDALSRACSKGEPITEARS